MAKSNFNFVGKLVPVKDKENFKGYTETVFDSKWVGQKLMFNVVAGDNSHLVEINAGYWQDESKNSVIKTMSKAKDGKPSEKIDIPYDKRNDPEMIEKVAGYKIFTIDTETFNHRKELEEKGDKEGLEAANKKRRHFLVGRDFCEFAKKVVYSDKAKDMMFRVTGDIEYSYSEKHGKYYASYEVKKIYRVDDGAEPSSEVNIDFYFAEGALDKEDFDETGKAIVSGYTQFYDSFTKKVWFAPIALVIRGTGDKEKDGKKIAGWERILSKFEDDQIRRITFACQKINGAQKQDIKFEDLDEDTQANIECGLIELEDAIRDAGGQMYGDRIQEIRIEKLGYGSTKGSETTAYILEDCVKKPKVEADEPEEDIFAGTDDVNTDEDDI
jgi:hypothetical protein